MWQLHWRRWQQRAFQHSCPTDESRCALICLTFEILSPSDATERGSFTRCIEMIEINRALKKKKQKNIDTKEWEHPQGSSSRWEWWKCFLWVPRLQISRKILLLLFFTFYLQQHCYVFFFSFLFPIFLDLGALLRLTLIGVNKHRLMKRCLLV